MLSIQVGRMSELPVGWRQRIRELSYGPDLAWGAWSWTFNDGSCWAACGFVDSEMVGWAALTKEVDVRPVAGVFIADQWRGRGYARVLAGTLLNSLVPTHLDRNDVVYASVSLWPKWPQVIEACGLRFEEWH